MDVVLGCQQLSKYCQQGVDTAAIANYVARYALLPYQSMVADTGCLNELWGVLSTHNTNPVRHALCVAQKHAEIALHVRRPGLLTKTGFSWLRPATTTCASSECRSCHDTHTFLFDCCSIS